MVRASFNASSDMLKPNGEIERERRKERWREPARERDGKSEIQWKRGPTRSKVSLLVRASFNASSDMLKSAERDEGMAELEG